MLGFMKDENQIAYGILRTATLSKQRQGETPQRRARRAAGELTKEYGHLGAAFGALSGLTLEQRRENGLKGAIARWGTIRDNQPMPASRKNLDMNQLAKRILDEATGDELKTEAPVKNQAAVELGKLGGKKGGAARAAKLSPEKRSEIAKKAATSRWKR